MPRVFIVNEPLRKNAETGELERFLPLESASEFGEIVKLTPDGSPPANLAPLLREIELGLEAWEDGDFIVLVGDQGLLAFAGAVVGAQIGIHAEKGNPILPIRFLKWSRHKQGYEAVVMHGDF